GLQLVTATRPGYGESTRDPGRTVASCAADTAAVADALGAERFYVTGQSGGGPHALACAALLPERVLACSSTAGVGPWDAPGLDFLADMAEENVEEMTDAAHDHDALIAYLEKMAGMFETVSPEDLAAELGGLVSPVDAGALTGNFAAHATAMVKGSVSTGIWGWFDDDLAFVRDWGFALEDIAVPVSVWQGGEDRMVPFAHGRWLAEAIPGARAYLLQDEGHLSLVVGSFDRIVDDMLDASEG
ncbi:MAG TPA: alpha/beta fold hydrolase, partial [Actinomycetota bacterium]|nr:alpha/beta fold hydrolase [Actinomycetota bacterium]